MKLEGRFSSINGQHFHRFLPFWILFSTHALDRFLAVISTDF